MCIRDRYLPKPKNKFQNTLINIISVSFAAQIVTLPLVIYYFHQWSFISILANLVVIPFAEILIVFALLMTVLITFSLQFSWINVLYDFSVTWILKLIHFFADIDFAFHKMIPITLLEVLAAFIIIYYLRSVSYTHLDVYKRQGGDFLADFDSFKTSVSSLSLIHI